MERLRRTLRTAQQILVGLALTVPVLAAAGVPPELIAKIGGVFSAAVAATAAFTNYLEDHGVKVPGVRRYEPGMSPAEQNARHYELGRLNATMNGLGFEAKRNADGSLVVVQADPLIAHEGRAGDIVPFSQT